MSQHLSEHKIDEDIWVDTESKYNKVNEAMFKFNKNFFCEAHKSYYNETDVKILDECRTIIPNGQFNNKICLNTFNTIDEIDNCKAFTKSASEIVKNPVYSEFDVWKPYCGKSDVFNMNDLVLYMVKPCRGNIFFNKKHCLVYGKYLKILKKSSIKLDTKNILKNS